MNMVVRVAGAVGKFIYGYIFGDDWMVAVVMILALVTTGLFQPVAPASNDSAHGLRSRDLPSQAIPLPSRGPHVGSQPGRNFPAETIAT